MTNELTSKPDAVLLGLCVAGAPHANLGSLRVDLRTRLVLELAVDVTLLLLSAGSWPRKEGTSGAWANLGSFRVGLLRRLTVELDVDVTLLLLSSGSWPENDMVGKGEKGRKIRRSVATAELTPNAKATENANYDAKATPFPL